MTRVAAYGTWESPLSAFDVASGALRLSQVALDGGAMYWVECRPHEGGRCTLVKQSPDGSTCDVTPPRINVRSRVHEYGGGAHTVRDGVACCVNFADQRVYRIGSSTDAPIQPLTPAGSWRYADLQYDTRRARLICVREDHSIAGGEPINTLVSIPMGGSGAGEASRSAGEVLESGYDFYSTPRLSPDGSRLAWLCWSHPDMPWDAAELWVADIDEGGGVARATRVAGGDSEAVYQPGWSPDGKLYFASDREGWWRIYRSAPLRAPDQPDWHVEPVVTDPPADAEFGRPQWVFGTSMWAFAGLSRLVVSYTRRGRWHLGLVDLATGWLQELAPDVQPHDWMAADDTHAVLVAGFDRRPDALVRVTLATGVVETVREASKVRVEAAFVSAPEPIEFPAGSSSTAHGFYYAPRNPSFQPPPGEAPPLIVTCHGGPTTTARCTFDPFIQYWTTRGFAVADVNYRGSSGYGRAYRQRLRGEWGVVDVEDAVSAAEFLSQGQPGTSRADPQRLIIRGGSAGGYTALRAITSGRHVFGAAASYYGICDLELLARDTHKFEARYMDGLVGPYPEAADTYRARSPLYAADRLSCALILLQGLDDPVVPPSQSRLMADAARKKGLPVAYLEYEGEQHGFRRIDTIIRSLEAELYFYGAIFHFPPADPVAPVLIENLSRRDD